MFGLIVGLAAVVMSSAGCDKKKEKEDRSFTRTTNPADRDESSVTEQIQVPERQKSRIDKNDLTPMGYLAVVVRTRDVGKMSKSMMNLRSIGQAVNMYKEAEESYPPSFQALTDAGYITSQAGVSAGDREYNIVYLPPASSTPNTTDVLAFDPVCYPVDTYAVLLVDGTTGKISLNELKAQLHQQGLK
jgi:hypothetical protein